MRYAIVSAVSLYVGAGLFAGLLMSAALPALNGLGVGYIAVTWPLQIICVEKNGCDPLPPEWARQYMFSFPVAP